MHSTLRTFFAKASFKSCTVAFLLARSSSTTLFLPRAMVTLSGMIFGGESGGFGGAQGEGRRSGVLLLGLPRVPVMMMVGMGMREMIKTWQWSSS